MPRVKAPSADDDIKIQQIIPEIAPKRIPKIETAAKRFASAKSELKLAQNEKKAAHDNLLAKLVEENLDSYEYGSLVVTIDEERKCKVKNASAVDDGDEE